MIKLALLAGSAILVLTPGSASAAGCGGQISCSCGDTVVASTYLRWNDPVVRNVCTGDGLIIGADNIVLNCGGRTVRGEDGGDGIVLENRERVTIRRCHVTGFDEGIELDDSSRNRLFSNKVFENFDDGINLSKDSDANTISYNTVKDNGGAGLVIDSFDEPPTASDENIVKANFFLGNNRQNGAGSGIEVCRECSGNQLLGNVINDTRTGDEDNPEGGIGMLISGTNSLILGNQGSRNADTGLLVEASGNKLQGNVFNFNDGNGICATVGNINGWGNFGFRNAEANVVFNVVECRED